MYLVRGLSRGNALAEVKGCAPRKCFDLHLEKVAQNTREILQ